MLEMRQTGPGRVELWNDGAPAGCGEWRPDELTWGRERAKIVRLRRFEASGEDMEPLRAYLEFLWKGDGVAAVVEPGGHLTWFSTALQKSYEKTAPF